MNEAYKKIIEELKQIKINYPIKYKQGFDDSSINDVYNNYRRIINNIDKNNVKKRNRTRRK